MLRGGGRPFVRTLHSFGGVRGNGTGEEGGCERQTRAAQRLPRAQRYTTLLYCACAFVRFQATDGVTELETFESITDCDRDRLLLFVAVAAVVEEEEEEDVVQSADGNERDLFNRDDKWMGNWGEGGGPFRFDRPLPRSSCRSLKKATLQIGLLRALHRVFLLFQLQGTRMGQTGGP